VHGGRGEALTREGEVEGEIDKRKKEEALDPIMMDEYQIKRIMEIDEERAMEYPNNIIWTTRREL